VGVGAERLNLSRLVAALGLNNVVELVGAIEQKLLVAEYHGADIFVAPSIIGTYGNRDGLPNVVLEAMACALPVIGSDVAGIPEAIRDGVTGNLVPPGNPNALASAILDLAHKSQKRIRLGQAAFRFVQENYPKHRCMERLARLLRSAGTPVPYTSNQGSGKIAP